MRRNYPIRSIRALRNSKERRVLLKEGKPIQNIKKINFPKKSNRKRKRQWIILAGMKDQQKINLNRKINHSQSIKWQKNQN